MHRTGNGFSDDESDSNSTSSGGSNEDDDSGDSGFEEAVEDDDDDDSGFEDAGPSPVLKTRTESKEEAVEDGDAPPSDDLKPMRPERSSKQVPLVVSSAEGIPSLSVTRSQISQENCDENDAQGSEEEPLGKECPQALSSGDNAPLESATPSGSQGRLMMDDAPVLEGDVPRQQGDGNSPRQQRDVVDDLDPTFSTPAHSRDRDEFRKGPPLAAVPVASGAGSRRVNREKKRSNEGLNAMSLMNIQISKDAGHVSPSGAPRLPGSKKKKKFSYVSDTTWMKSKEELADTSSPSLELASRVAVTGGHSPSQAPPARKPLSSDCAAPETTVSAAEVDQASTSRRNRHRPPREKDQGPTEADTGSRRVRVV